MLFKAYLAKLAENPGFFTWVFMKIRKTRVYFWTWFRFQNVQIKPAVIFKRRQLMMKRLGKYATSDTKTRAFSSRTHVCFISADAFVVVVWVFLFRDGFLAAACRSRATTTDSLSISAAATVLLFAILVQFSPPLHLFHFRTLVLKPDLNNSDAQSRLLAQLLTDLG